jgi:hypothetical protein
MAGPLREAAALCTRHLVHPLSADLFGASRTGSIVLALRPARRRRLAVRAWLVAGALVSVCGCSDVLGPRASLGPGAIVRGRGLYNEVITATNNEQILELIVRSRYAEPAGLLSVASVTANLRAAGSAGAQFGIGPSSNYSGNLVPLSLGFAYEENPTIAYATVQGERYAKAMLSPVGLDMLVLLAASENAPARLTAVLVKQLNGLRNPQYGSPEARAAFEKSIDLLDELGRAGRATWTSTAPQGGGVALVIHDYAGQGGVVQELLRLWGLPPSLARGDREIVLPLNLAVGRTTKAELNVVTRSVYELVNLAANAVDVPPEHAALGLTDHALDRVSSFQGLLRIHSSPGAPSTAVLVSVRHRGYWFYISADDPESKRAFQLLQVLIGMLLVEGTPQSVPTLTIPVAN